MLSVYLGKGVVLFANESSRRTNAITETTDLSKYQLVEPGDFVLNNQQAWRGSVGVSGYRGLVSPAYIVLSFKTPIVTEFANFALQSRHMVGQYLVYSKGVGSIQRNISWNDLKHSLLPIPPLGEQKKIVEFLSTKTSLIDAQQRERERELRLLDELKQAEIANVVTRGLNPDVPMKDSGIPWIGQIPAHWKSIRIKYLFKEEDERNVDLSFPLLTFSRKKGVIPFSDANEKAPSASDLSKYKIIHAGQLLENRMQAWSGMFAKAEIDGCVSPEYSVFSPLSDDVCVDFFAHLFRTNQYVAHWANLSRGVGDGFNRLYTPQFHSVFAIVPPIEEQKAIVEYIQQKNAAIDEMIANLRAEIDFLTEYKQRLIADVVTGQLKVD